MSNNIPLVSIIVNCFNGEKYLKKCLESIIDQKYQNWEIIFWDNISTDNSRKIVESYRDSRIKYFKSEEHVTLYSARNLALKKISGEFVCFLDVDDWWTPDKISSQINFLNKNSNIEILYTNFFNYFEGRKNKKIFSKQALPFGRITQNLLDHYKIGILTVMIKRSILQENFFKENYEIIADFDFFLKLSLQKNISVIQTPLAYYRIHSENLSKKKLNQQIEEIEDWYNRNVDTKHFKDYSLKGVKLSIQILRIKKYLIDGNKKNALMEIFQKPISLRKLKFLGFISFSKENIKKILS